METCTDCNKTSADLLTISTDEQICDDCAADRYDRHTTID